MGSGALESRRAPGRLLSARHGSGRGRVRERPCRPPAGFANRHLQTCLGSLWPARLHSRPRRDRRESRDGDFVDVDWVGPGPGAPWALVLPGITGNLSSPYAVRLLGRLAASGYRAGLLNHRGLSGTPNRLAGAYHAGFTRDLDLVAGGLAKRHGPGVVVAFSMGGNVLLKWLGESGRDAPVRAAVAVSTPFRLAPAARQLCSGRWRVYDRCLTAGLRRFMKRKFALTPPPFPLPNMQALDSLRKFDDHITAPLHGFVDAADYYAKSSCFPWLACIAVPTLAINSRDDPLVPRRTLPTDEDLAPAVTLELSDHGGHVGFLGRGRFGLPRFALDDRILEFLRTA